MRTHRSYWHWSTFAFALVAAGAMATLPDCSNSAGTSEEGKYVGSGANPATGTLSASPGSTPETDPYVNGAPLPSDGNTLDFGPNVLVFDPSMDSQTMQNQVNTIINKQIASQFGTGRYAYFFKPGSYNLSVSLGYYMTLHGLGLTPDDVVINGTVESTAAWNNYNATVNFWRSAENFAVNPTYNNSTSVWAVSQASALRRVHVKGNLNLWDGGWSSGGFVADSVIDSVITSGSQQQFITRNMTLTKWQGGVWNMVFVGDTQTPSPSWPAPPYSIVAQTPVIREKPYLVIDATGQYQVAQPALRQNSSGPSWGASSPNNALRPIAEFYVAHADKDDAFSLNAALSRGRSLILTPGIYAVHQALHITNPNTIVLGLGQATIQPTQGTEAVLVDDIDGVSISGLILDAGLVKSPSMLTVGASVSTTRHTQNPVLVADVSCRVGGASAGNTDVCAIVNSHDVIFDNVWLWRADHGQGVGWTVNTATNGLVVNGDYMSAYGLFVEHFEQYQTLWNGDYGRTYMYQSEIPYDVPDQASWMHDGTNGYASYKVANTVTHHDAQGLGVYCVFYNKISTYDTIEFPNAPGVNVSHMTTQWLGVDPNSSIMHIYNGTGPAVVKGNASAWSAN